jgi:hypothetical protein
MVLILARRLIEWLGRKNGLFDANAKGEAFAVAPSGDIRTSEIAGFGLAPSAEKRRGFAANERTIQ